MTEPTIPEALMLSALLAIARGKPDCKGCRWDNPCDKCFAAQAVASVMDWPQFEKWRKHYRITATRKRKLK